MTDIALKPPLELSVEIIDANGVRSRWDSGDKDGGNRPQSLSFNTKRGEGFAEASVTLSRRIDRDYVDQHLFDEVSFIAADGTIAYEGRVAAMPRSLTDSHSISIQLAGWMSHARDQPFTMIFVDRDLSAWTAPSRARQATLLTNNFSVQSFDASRDPTNTVPAITTSISGAWVSPYSPVSEALYDAGPGCKIRYIYFDLTGIQSSGGALDAGFIAFVQGGDADDTFTNISSDQWAGSSGATYYTFTPSVRYGALHLRVGATPGGGDGFQGSAFWRNVAVYGDHDITLGGSAPGGVPASEVIKWIAGRYCPKLDVSGVRTTGWPIPHLVFREPTDPYDAFLAVNAFHLWELGVWENKTLTFGPTNRLDYDWDVRLSDQVTVDLQGDSTEDLANGIIVEYTNVVTGNKDSLTPAVYTDLADPDAGNPVTRHGLKRWTKLSLSAPTTTESALQIGKAALAEFNAPKAPGTITVTGHLRDRAGHWQQGWKVRAGDTIAITDHPNDSPRLVTETSWNHDSKQMTITVDSTAKRLDAVLDRVGAALTAAGLG